MSQLIQLAQPLLDSWLAPLHGYIQRDPAALLLVPSMLFLLVYIRGVTRR